MAMVETVVHAVPVVAAEGDAIVAAEVDAAEDTAAMVAVAAVQETS